MSIMTTQPGVWARRCKAEKLPAINKYIVVQDYTGRERVLLFSRELRHKDMVPANCEAVAAGFAVSTGETLLVLASESDSLRLGPRPGDKRMLERFLGL